mgnify:CR=1 FL=1
MYRFGWEALYHFPPEEVQKVLFPDTEPLFLFEVEHYKLKKRKKECKKVLVLMFLIGLILYLSVQKKKSNITYDCFE